MRMCRSGPVFYMHARADYVDDIQLSYLLKLGFAMNKVSAHKPERGGEPAGTPKTSSKGDASPRKADCRPEIGSVARNLVHGCCEKGSLLTRPTPYSNWCTFFEITKELDARSKEAINSCIASITGPKDTLFWCSPCTRGCLRQIFNIFKAIRRESL